MKTIKIILLVFSLFVLATIDVAAQNIKEDKIREMLELSGSSDQFYAVIDQMIDLQKESYEGRIENDFFDSFRKRLKETGYEELIEKLMPIYKKYYTIEEVEGIIAFYKSDVGQSFIKKTPLVMSESMQIGADWGEKLAIEILDEMEAQSKENEYLENENLEKENDESERKFNVIIEEDCSRFRKGNFVSYLADGQEVKYVRKKNKQTEIMHDKEGDFKIEWISNNRYKLTRLQDVDDGFNGKTLTCNIYKVFENGYKVISRFEDIDLYFDTELLFSK